MWVPARKVDLCPALILLDSSLYDFLFFSSWLTDYTIVGKEVMLPSQAHPSSPT